MPDYGTDVWCDGDLRPDMPEISGRLLLAQDLAARYETPEGTLNWDPQGIDYGYDLRLLVNTKQRDFVAIGQRIVSECQKDDRVEYAEATIETRADGFTVKLRVFDEEGPFDMTLSVSEISVELLVNGV